MVIVIVLLALVVVLVGVVVALAVGGQKSRSAKHDEAWQAKVREEYTPPPLDDD